MSIFYLSGRTATTTPTALRGPHLVGLDSDTVNGEIHILEVGVSNYIATAVTLALRRLTGGTSGADLTEVLGAPGSRLPDAVAKQVHTADATGGGEICRTTLAAAIGASWAWTFAKGDLVIPAAATPNQIGIVAPEGSGIHFDYYIKWLE